MCNERTHLESKLGRPKYQKSSFRFLVYKPGNTEDLNQYTIFQEIYMNDKHPNFNDMKDVLSVVFCPEDLANSEVWWIKAYWNCIKNIWKDIKGTEIKILNKENIEEFLEFNMKLIAFSNPDYLHEE